MKNKEYEVVVRIPGGRVHGWTMPRDRRGRTDCQCVAETVGPRISIRPVILDSAVIEFNVNTGL